MKARRFLAVVLAVTLLLLGLGAGAWWLLWQRSPLQLQHRGLAPPRAARFVPRDAALSFYLLSDAEEPLAYARAAAPPRQRREAVDALARLRDGAFAAAGLDYAGELASWLGSETGLWLVQAQPAGAAGWVLALSSRDGDGARRFLQRYWQTRSLAGTELQISSYRGMGLISGRGALLGREPMPLATALIDDDLVLLASGRGVLEQALDVSQIDELNQAGDPHLRQRLSQLGQGVALLTARSDTLQDWVGLASPLSHGELVAALRPDGRQLLLDGWLEPEQEPRLSEPRSPAQALDLDVAQAMSLLQSFHGEASALALLQDPAHWPEAWRQTALALFQVSQARPSGPLPGLLLDAAEGPLLWRTAADGWLLGSAAGQPDAAALDQPLRDLGFLSGPLELDGDAVQVWTRLRASPAPHRRGESAEALEVSLGAARRVETDRAWWSDSLEVLTRQRQSRSAPRELLARLDALALPAAALQWAGARQPAEQLLQGWSGWRLLCALAGQPLGEAVHGLALAVQPEQEALHLRLRFDFG